ncbi:hypothetical protein J6590_074625 [Homalodisca vitripennis]|nr:hypothetical protein J6590_074625 [Homalodisca vitripennis]
MAGSLSYLTHSGIRSHDLFETYFTNDKWLRLRFSYCLTRLEESVYTAKDARSEYNYTFRNEKPDIILSYQTIHRQ